MRAPQNRKVVVVGYAAATALGNSFAKTWENAVAGKAGFRRLSRCEVETRSNVVGEIPDWQPETFDYVSRKDASLWNANYVFLTMEMCRQALEDAGLEITPQTGPRTACLIGSALNGSDAYRIAMDNYTRFGPLKVSPYLLPNLCANLPAGKAAMQLGFTGPIFSPQGACASGNHAIAAGSRMIRDGDCDFALVGGVETCLIPTFSLQPLVENALSHGLFPKPDHCCLLLQIHAEGEQLIIHIEDNGIGMSEADCRRLLNGTSKGIGTANVHQRLNGLYPGRSEFLLSSKEHEGTAITMKIPLERGPVS